jgi:predicted permease
LIGPLAIVNLRPIANSSPPSFRLRVIVDTLFDSIRYSLRQFRLAPVFTITAVLTLALGIGGTTAIFTLIHAVMLQSLPVADPAALYRIGEGDDCCVSGGPQDRWGFFSYPLFVQLAAQTPEFVQVTAFQAGGARLSVRRERVAEAARPLRTEYVTGNYFSTLGVGALGGRVFGDDDDKASAAPVAVMSHHTWTVTYGGDPSIVGSTFVLQGHPFTIVGITPPGFYGETLRGDPPDLWLPLQQEPLIAGAGSLLRQPVSAWLRALGRLRPGASVDGMGPRLTAVLRNWLMHDAGYPANWMPNVERTLPNQVLNVIPAGGGVTVMKEEYGERLRILLAVCALVLLIACANVANLLLARAVSRRTQTAVRLAIGASRRQIVMHALVEAVLLAAGGAIAGLAVAIGAAQLLLSLAFSQTRFLPISTRPSFVVLAFAFGLALVTGVVFGAAPAWFATRTNPVDALRGAGRTTRDHSSIARQALLVLQATLAVVLVAGATMLARSLGHLESMDFGYRVDGRVVVGINPLPATYTMPQLQALYRAVEQRLTSLPGVDGAGLALYNPLTDNWGEGVFVQGQPLPRPGQSAGASWDRVSANYLRHFGATLVKGRFFNEHDNETSDLVAVVNEGFVRKFFKVGEDPLGQHFGLDYPENAGTFRIVGVVRDMRFAGFQLRQPPRSMFYVPLAQTVPYTQAVMQRIELQSHFVGGLMLATAVPPGTLEPVLTRALAELDPNLTVTSVRTMRQRVAMTFDEDRAVATLAGLFGGVALLLAAIGLYGVTAYSVAQRTNEIGLRMALGATRARIVDLILRSAFVRVAAGLLLGLPLAVVAGRLISAQLYGVSYWDPVALSVAAVSLGACALAAAMVPASRAAGLSPMRALRTE